MIELTIDNIPVQAPEESTILDVARSLGIDIPTLCHRDGCSPTVSCMVCVVYNIGADRLVPACATTVARGMRIETDSDRVCEARKDAVDLLLSEHVGDCEAPCRRACPAGMNIPLMIRQIGRNDLARVIETIMDDIALPAVLGRICPAPCEKACRRGSYDNPIAICSLKRFAADADLAKHKPYRPESTPHSGKKAAIVGAGPAGLAAAYHLTRYGHECRIFDRNAAPGGALRYDIPRERLPGKILDTEVERILAMGAVIEPNRTMGTDFNLGELRDDYNAVVLAFGETGAEDMDIPGLERTSRGITIDRNTYETSISGVFAGGNAVGSGKLAVRSVAHGKGIARSVDAFVRGGTLPGKRIQPPSAMGKLIEGETGEYLGEAAPYGRVVHTDGDTAGYSPDEAVSEAARCFRCDCRKSLSCKLRQYAERYGADQRRFGSEPRKRFQRNIQHDFVVFEPGKCIKCGICIEITKNAGEEFGLTFIHRGFDVVVAVPLGESLKNGLVSVAKECVEACPTGALAMREGEEGERSDSR